jgi:threonine aldolase
VEYARELCAAAGEVPIEADYYSVGGAVAALEQQFAKLLGKKSAVFLPTGTLANHLAVRRLAGSDRRVLVQAESHLYNDSGDCAEVLSGLTLVPLPSAQTGFTAGQAEEALGRAATGKVETRIGVISIETPVRRLDHAMFDFDEMGRVCALARRHGIRLHLDGARLFNIPHHTGRTVEDFTSLFDTVYVSLWKCFNAASGAILAGSRAHIEGLYHARRMFGGSLPQAWPVAAVALRYATGYLEEYSRAWGVASRFLSALARDERFVVERVPNGTSAFRLRVRGVEPGTLADRLASRQIVVPHPAENGTFRMIVNTSLNRADPDALARAFAVAARE